MKIGILADIHEHVRELRRAIDVLRGLGAERFVVLGDVFETGQRIEETVRLLREVGAVDVWGNHDLGLCHEPTAAVRARYAAVVGYMETLRPRLELAGCLFTHGLPRWDATDPSVYYLGERPETPEGLAGAFGAPSPTRPARTTTTPWPSRKMRSGSCRNGSGSRVESSHDRIRMAGLRRPNADAGIPAGQGQRAEAAAVRRGLLPDGLAPDDQR
jgi:Calcineurin-like phosphoesterase superfamily domain